MIISRLRPGGAVGLALVFASLGVLVTAAPASAIHHGKRTSTEKHPWAVAIEDPDGFQFCGGTVVDERFVLTAAHCVDGRTPASLRVVVGRTDLRTDDGEVIKVDEIWVHPKYEPVAMGVDVALLTLRNEVTTGTLELAVPQDGADGLGALTKVYGWGRTESHPTGSPILRTTTIELAGLDGCDPYTQPDESPKKRLCGLPPPEGDGQESICPGDSGGPLVASGRLIGVVSTGNKFCDDQFPVSVFTRVAPWTKSLRAQMESIAPS